MNFVKRNNFTSNVRNESHLGRRLHEMLLDEFAKLKSPLNKIKLTRKPAIEAQTL